MVPSMLNLEKTTKPPPTFIKTNKVTHAPQEIVNSYGIPRYREYNPGVVTVITYPFTFAIMFGDAGHGVLLLVFALFMLWMEKSWTGKKLNEMIDMAFQGTQA